MSPRPRATFAKRQKEQARQEKQRAKAERKQQRKLGGQPDDADLGSNQDSSLDFAVAAPEENEAVTEP